MRKIEDLPFCPGDICPSCESKSVQLYSVYHCESCNNLSKCPEDAEVKQGSLAPERIIVRLKGDRGFDNYIEIAISESGRLLVMHNKGMEIIKVEYPDV